MNENGRSQEQMSDPGEPRHEEETTGTEPSLDHAEAQEHRVQPDYGQTYPLTQAQLSTQPQPDAVQYQETNQRAQQPVQQVGQQPQQAQSSQYSTTHQGQPYSESFGVSSGQPSQYQPSPYQTYATPSNQSSMQSGQYQQPQVQQSAYQYQPVQQPQQASAQPSAYGQQPDLQTPMAQPQYVQSQQAQPQSTQQAQYMQSQYASSQQPQPQPQPQYVQMQQPQAQYGQQYVQSQPSPQVQSQYTQPQYVQSQQAQPQPQYMQPMQQPAASASNAAWYHMDPVRQAALTAWLTKARKQFSAVGFALVLVVGVWYFLTTLIRLVVSALGVSKNLPMWADLLMGNGPLYVAAIPLSLLIFRKLPKVKRKTSTMSVRMFMTVMLASFPISVVGSWIGNLLSALLSNNQAHNGIAELAKGLDPFSLFLFTVIIAPIFEEWLFRRLLIDHVQQYGEKTAILVSAVAFGLFHGNLFQFFYAFGFGLLLAYVYVRTGKLRYTIAMHMTFNFLNGFVGQMTLLPMSKSTLNAVDSGTFADIDKVISSGHGMELVPYLIFVLFTLVCLIAGIVVIIINRKKLVFHTAPEELPRGTRVKTALGNPGVIVYIVLSIMLMIAALFN
jgi:uncharacterized protein